MQFVRLPTLHFTCSENHTKFILNIYVITHFERAIYMPGVIKTLNGDNIFYAPTGF